MNIEQIKSGIEARKAEIVKLEKQLKAAENITWLKNRAVGNCIDIYTNWNDDEIDDMPRAMRMAWQTGEKLREHGIEIEN